MIEATMSRYIYLLGTAGEFRLEGSGDVGNVGLQPAQRPNGFIRPAPCVLM